jgi:hypothetical protein
MSDAIAAVLLTGASNVLILAVTLFSQSWRESLHYERAQRDAQIERVRAIYRLALQGDQAILESANGAGHPLVGGENIAERDSQLGAHQSRVDPNASSGSENWWAPQQLIERMESVQRQLHFSVGMSNACSCIWESCRLPSLRVS